MFTSAHFDEVILDMLFLPPDLGPKIRRSVELQIEDSRPEIALPGFRRIDPAKSFTWEPGAFLKMS